MEITSIIVRPKITEKAQILKALAVPKLTFVVNKKASKRQIAAAFELMFGMKPTKINTLNRKPVPTRFLNKSKNNYTKATKIAYVTVSSQDFSAWKQKAEESMSAQDKEIAEAVENVELPVVEEAKEEKENKE